MLKSIFSFCLLAVFSLNAAVLFDFTKEQYPVTLWQAKKFEQSAVYQKDGLRISWNPGKNTVCIFHFPKTKKEAFGAFSRASCFVELEVPEGSPIQTFNVRFIDSGKEVFQWRGRADFRKGGLFRLKIPMTPKNFQVSFRGNNDKKIDFPLSFYSCTASAEKNSTEASFVLKKIEFEPTVESDLSHVKFDLETGHVSRVLKKGEERKLTLLLHNPGNSPLPCNAKIEFRDFYGNTVSTEAALVLPAEKTLKYRPEVVLPRLGIWDVHLRLESKDGSRFAESTRSLAYMVPAGPNPPGKEGFIFGICIPGWYDPGIFPLEAETAALCGASALRLNFRWRELEKAPGKWDVSRLEQIMSEYEKRGIEVMPILSNPPVWARKDKPNSLPDFQEWRKYTGYFFRNYGKRIRWWEIWNEPELFSFSDFGAPEYVELQKIAREEQRKSAPDVKLLTGGFATVNAHSNSKEGFQEYVLDKGRGYYDVHAFHGHGGFKSYVKQIEGKFLPMRKRLGITAPWFANETAVSSYGIGEKSQAETLFKKFLYSWSAGSIGYNWYNLRNNGFIANNPEHNYGLVTFDFYPKPAYVAYNTLATVYRNKSFVRRYSGNPEIWMLEFRGDGERAVAVWNDSPAEVADVTAIFRSDARSVEAVDLMGNSANLPLTGGMLMHPITKNPETLRFKGAGRVEYLGDLVKGELKGHAIPGRPARLELSFFNPLPENLVFHLRAEKTEGIETSSIPSRFTVNAGEHKTLTATVTVSKEKAGRNNLLVLHADCPGHRSVLRIPLKPVVFIPAERSGGEWDFVLDRKEQVVSLFDADPGSVHRLWSGPQDLSAKIAFSLKSGVWTLRFSVTDDRHVQPNRGVNVWQGDNVQIAFQAPGQKSLWVAGLTLLADGKPELYLWESPASFDAKKVLETWTLKARRTGTRTEYEVKIPLAGIGMNSDLLKQGIRFNALVNDNDGYGRKGWIQITEGIAGNRSAEKFPLVIFESD